MPEELRKATRLSPLHSNDFASDLGRAAQEAYYDRPLARKQANDDATLRGNKSRQMALDDIDRGVEHSPTTKRDIVLPDEPQRSPTGKKSVTGTRSMKGRR
jgi:hypothetical protein